MLVLIGHAGALSGNNFPFHIGKIPLTSLAVYCFWILSGYLVKPGLINGRVRDYLIRRTIRIYPAYFGVLAFTGFGLSFLWQRFFHVKGFSVLDPIRYVVFNLLPPPGIFTQESKNISFLSGLPVSKVDPGIPNGSLWS